jgi:arsenate reductase
MAHGFLQSFDKSFQVYSAGTKPAEKVNERAIAVMKESGIDISSHRPQSLEKYMNDDWDYVITVCQNAKENCPVFSGNVETRLHFGFDDPAQATGTEDEIMNEFRRVRDEIKRKFYSFYTNELY